MNNILTLRGQSFQQASRTNKPGPVNIPKGTTIHLSHLESLHNCLVRVSKFWAQEEFIEGALISVYYDRIVAKSNRIGAYFRVKSNSHSNDTVVGAKFNSDKTKHIITHYISQETLNKTIELSHQVIALFRHAFPSEVLSYQDFNKSSTFDNLPYPKYGLSKTTFKQLLRDTIFVEKFDIETASLPSTKEAIVSFYDVDMNIHDLLKKLDIHISSANMLDDTTVLLDEKYVERVFTHIPYLVSMAVEDFSTLFPENFHSAAQQISSFIPPPHNEPTIGVIDTLFDEQVYFKDWVDYHDCISREIRREAKDYEHGTAVSSLIVDAPNLNKNLDDGCGRFRVRHFGVALHKGFNSFSIIKKIKEIVSQNTDIKVWNLSLGSNDEIKDNFISAEAAVLDDIQFEYDVIFVIAGTNASDSSLQRKKIGAPADSLNSVVVNAVDFSGQPTRYTRQGVVLSFFIKPDIAYYGGGNGQYINVCKPLGLAHVTGTSYAAPFIARKLAYLIHIMGLSREEAKALLVDSAIQWNDKKTFEETTLIGNGIVPIKIQDILSTPDDEIKFIVSGVSEKYHSYNYRFPVPIVNQKYPYVAKATMCYFPKCSRHQGVDYTNTELNLHFGPLTNNGIKPINRDKQNLDDAPGYIKEDRARGLFRKWDNIKHIREVFSSRKQAKEVMNKSSPLWGMSIRTLERLHSRDGEGIRFGVVVTLKEIKGVNRIDDFIKQASLHGWLVTELSVKAQVNIYNKLSEEIEFE